LGDANQGQYDSNNALTRLTFQGMCFIELPLGNLEFNSFGFYRLNCPWIKLVVEDVDD